MKTNSSLTVLEKLSFIIRVFFEEDILKLSGFIGLEFSKVFPSVSTRVSKLLLFSVVAKGRLNRSFSSIKILSKFGNSKSKGFSKLFVGVTSGSSGTSGVLPTHVLEADKSLSGEQLVQVAALPEHVAQFESQDVQLPPWS